MPAEFCENRTKYRLDGALRQLLERKPLDQIRIRELTELCGIRRQSFYYHFPDVYALFQWSLQQEGDRLLERQGSFLTWQQVMEDLLEYTAENRGYYRAVLANQGRAGLRQVLKAPLEGLLKAIRDYYRSRCGVLPELEEQTRWECEETMLFTRHSPRQYDISALRGTGTCYLPFTKFDAVDEADGAYNNITSFTIGKSKYVSVSAKSIEDATLAEDCEIYDLADEDISDLADIKALQDAGKTVTISFMYDDDDNVITSLYVVSVTTPKE